jgi:hypothetical protein
LQLQGPVYLVPDVVQCTVSSKEFLGIRQAVLHFELGTNSVMIYCGNEILLNINISGKKAQNQVISYINIMSKSSTFTF